MAAKQIKVVFLNCDQGMGTLIRIYNSAGTLANLALIDLGSSAGTKQYASDALNEVMKALNEMKTAGVAPKIDFLLISHQDYDHWSLLPDLLVKIKDKVSNCTVGEMYRAGSNWSQRAVDAIDDWQKHFKKKCTPLPAPTSHYAPELSEKPLKDIDNVIFRILCANIPIESREPSRQKNGTSAVVAIKFGKVHVILPGDATADTLNWINTEVFAAYMESPVPNCLALGAPHHGALRTIASNFQTDKPNLSVAKVFAENVGAKNVVASAGYYSHYKHPSKECLEVLAGEEVSKDKEEHSFVWFDFSKYKWLEEEKDRRGIYTTVVGLYTPPQNWSFTIDNQGRITFELRTAQADEIPFPRTDRYPAVPHTS